MLGPPRKLAPPLITPAAETPAAASAAPAAPISPLTSVLPSAGGPAEDAPQSVLAGSADGEEEIAEELAETPPIEAITLRFEWDEPVAAAVFRRAGYLWAVFDKAVDLDMDRLRAAAGNAVHSMERLAARRATALRMKTVAGVNPRLRRDGLAWLLDLRQQIMEPETTIDVAPEPNSPVGTRLFLPVAEPGNVIALHDPEVGDTLVVIPVIPLGHGINLSYDYPQFSILPSGQGVVLKSHIDDLRVRPLRQGVEVTSGAGLYVSAVSDALLANTRLASPRPLSRVFDMEKWRREGVGSFWSNKQKLQHAVATAKKEERNGPRMDLVRFYFAHGFATEALGVLKLVGEDQPNKLSDAEFRAMRGASRFLMNRLVAAQEDLGHSSLADNDEAVFWRALVRAAAYDLAGAAPDLKRTGGITRPYPKALKIPLGTLVAEAAVEVGDSRLASRYLDVLKMIGPSRQQRDHLDYVEGRLKELAGDFDAAIETWEAVQKGPHRPSRAKAAVARAELLYKLNRINRSQAIEELEKLRFAWRGDEFEFKLLRRLGQLYVEEGNFRDGLRTLKQAATHFRTHEQVSEVTQRMAEVFTDLYLNGKADTFSPVAAIALYEDFKELTPAGPKGDEMIRKLADRLVAVDLLDGAAKLLANQVHFRLKGVEKARVGARLALVYILDRRFDAALQVLGVSHGPGLGDDLETQRRHLRGRALVGLERGNEALVLLDGDATPNAQLLLAEINWKKKQWKPAAAALGQVVRRLARGQPLDEREARHVLDLAVALTLSGNEGALDQLRQAHGKAMADSPYKDAFRLIAAPSTDGLMNYRNIAEKMKEVEGFQSFMTAYRDQLRAKKLSAIN